MKRLLILACLALASCSTVTTDEDPDGRAPESDRDLVSQPLKVPALEDMAKTPERTLEGGMVAVTYDALPGWADDDLDQVWKAFINNCKGLMRPVSGSLTLPARAAPRVWQPVCEAAQQADLDEDTADPAAVRAFLEEHLQPWRLLNAQGQPASNTVTGYYEPRVQGSRSRHDDYQWPLYETPDDLLTIDLGEVYPELAGKRVRGKLDGQRVVPYDTRADIAESESRQPPVITWIDDPVEAFFLQIQGSGQVELDKGGVIRLAYDDHNGRPYASIGQWLVDQKEMTLDQASMGSIKQWAREHPHRVQEMLNANPAMVFFKEEAVSDSDLGPRGAYGIALAPQRAIAVDPAFVPLGTPVYLSTREPGSQTPLRRLVFAQDTGAAIKGAARADFFWGTGTQAGEQAGRMKQPGDMWLLWPKHAGKPSAR